MVDDGRYEGEEVRAITLDESPLFLRKQHYSIEQQASYRMYWDVWPKGREQTTLARILTSLVFFERALEQGSHCVGFGLSSLFSS